MIEPKSIDECVYFTRRNDSNSKVVVWVFREKCPQCKEGLMGKPIDQKTGRFKIRATEYVCPKCNYSINEEGYESNLMANIKYECSCGYNGELQIPFKRKKTMKFDDELQKKVSVDALIFECDKCKKKIYIAKKMK